MSSERPVLPLNKKSLAFISDWNWWVTAPLWKFPSIKAILICNGVVWSSQEQFSVFPISQIRNFREAFSPLIKNSCRYLPQGASFVVNLLNVLQTILLKLTLQAGWVFIFCEKWKLILQVKEKKIKVSWKTHFEGLVLEIPLRMSPIGVCMFRPVLLQMGVHLGHWVCSKTAVSCLWPSEVTLRR